jgi:pimeloyl-ACP methyl ester carboxylesterase
MREPLPTVLIPGLLCTPELYAPQIPLLWRFGPVTIADHTRDDSMAGIAGRILADAPPRFVLMGLSMGGYAALEIMRQAPGRVARLALIDTQARPDTPEQSERRRGQMAAAREGRLAEAAAQLYPLMVHPRRHQDPALQALWRRMAEDTGAAAFVNQQAAIMGRPDSRPDLGGIQCPTLVLVGEQDALTPPDRGEEMAAAIQGARLAIIPDSGHLSPVEQPQAVSAALAAWLGEEILPR